MKTYVEETMGGDAEGSAYGSTGRHGGGTLSRESFVEEVGLVWEAAGSPRMDGRIVAYLLITDVPHVSSAELARALRVSAGSVSLATRRLVEAGFIRRHAVPGERSHYFRVDDDVWGSFLAGERRYLERQEELADHALALLGPEEEAPRRRLTNMRDYMRWICGSHQDLLTQWRAYRAETGGVLPHQQTPTTDVKETRGRPSAGLSPILAQRLVPDVLWVVAEPLLPSGSGSERAAFTAVVYVLASGCGWQQLPAQFGISHSVAHRRFTAWSRDGFWQRWLDAVSEAHGEAADLGWCKLIAQAAMDRQPGGRR
ncbi:transposase [Actinomadura sp. 9N215]|uniref:transposase n=1 Tax=Actinomadura sp. 9N215 TaxID=3375150 RepID=UPI0037B8ED23